VCVYIGSEEELGSSEESGKDWDELEEEAKKGAIKTSLFKIFDCVFVFIRNYQVLGENNRTA